LGLKWDEDVDLDAGTITVRHAQQGVDGELKLVEPKSDRSRRTIALPDFAVRALSRVRLMRYGADIAVCRHAANIALGRAHEEGA